MEDMTGMDLINTESIGRDTNIMSQYRLIRKYKKAVRNVFKKKHKKKYEFLLIKSTLILGNNLFSQSIENNKDINSEISQIETGKENTIGNDQLKKEKNIKIESSSETGNGYSIRERGIEKMNFYIPVREQNKINTYGEFDYRNDKNVFKYTFGEGYVALNGKWDFNYRITRESYRYKLDESKMSSLNSWDNEISLSRKNNSFRIGKREFGSALSFGIKHTENNVKAMGNSRDYKFYISQKISTFSSKLGRGGTFSEYGITLNGIKGSIRDGYSVLGSVGSNTALGYGFQWSNSLEGEYMDYNNYKGSLRVKYETLFRWTYELGKHFAFSPETTFKAEKYFSNKTGNLTVESSVGSYLLYSRNFTDKFRIYGKVGPVLKYERTRYGEYEYRKSQLAGYAKIGFEYIF